MITYHNNGEYWYRNTDPIWFRTIKWFAWAGGYIPFTRYRKTKLQLPTFKDFTPFSLLGHRITFYSWGWQINILQNYLVYTNKRRDEPSSIYVSKDGTPDNAHAWLFNPPKSIVAKAR